jgi:hypothetical protein
VDEDFDEVLGRLSEACYGNQDDAGFQQTRARLIELLGWRHKYKWWLLRGHKRRAHHIS